MPLKQTKLNRKRHHAWLYSVVFQGRFSACLVFVLFASFMIQPFHKAMANEALPEAVPETPSVAEEVQMQEEESPVTPDTTSEVVSEEQVPTTDGDEVLEDSEPPVVVDELPIDEETSDNSDNNTQTEEPSIEIIDPEATTTIEQIVETGEVKEVEYVVTEENFYQFGKNACVAIGDGTYHCSKKTTTEADTQSVAYSEQGASGNMEIFLKTSRGKVKQITENNYDDTSPHYDAESMRLTWQRLIDGRYQIIVFDIMESSETQLTFSKTNNMEPKISEAGVVWQAWDNSDWEVMFFDGAYTEQITDNDAQDVAPVIQDGYVLWSVLGLDEQEARVYSIDTKETTSITGHEGGSIINPRFILVYDTEFENGDVITQSFDPATGLSEPVGSTPAPEPVNIPESDPTGEIRALLIQGKNQKDEKDMADISPDDNSASSTSQDEPGTLNLNQNSDETTPAVANTPVNDFELTEFDLVIPQNALENALSSTQ